MSASEIQQQRTRGYFLEAAKEILRGEGLKVASARNIADRAGYSYTALYNHFKDMNSLIFACVQDFQHEIEQSINLAVSSTDSGKEKIIMGITAWINYFIQYPGIFELFFIERIGDIERRNEISELIYDSAATACREGFTLLIENREISRESADICLDTIRYQITGILLYYSNRINPADYTSLMKILERQVETILKPVIT